MSKDPYSGSIGGLESPPRNLVVVDYSTGDVDFSLEPCRGFNVDQDGTVMVDMVGVGTNVPFHVTKGNNPCRATKVYQTNTTEGMSLSRIS